MKNKLIIPAAVLALVSAAPAALTVTSEDFTGQGTNASSASFWLGVTGWTESNTTNFNDFALRGDNTGGALNDTATVADRVTPGVKNGGYFYSAIGTRDLMTTLNVTGINYTRGGTLAASGSPGENDPFLLSIYKANPGSVNPADGNAITTLAGATLLGSATVTEGGAAGSGNPFNLNFDISGATANDVLFVHFSRAAAGNAFFDSLGFAIVPEPSAAMLGGLGMLALLRRRRR